jgi:hypothetical protein
MSLEVLQAALNAEMAARRLTRSAFAKMLHMDPGTLGDLLDGKRRPKAPTQGKIETYFEWPAGTVAEVLAGRRGLPGTARVSPVEQAFARALLDLDLSDLPPAAQEEVITAARLTALQKAREIRKSLEE